MIPRPSRIPLLLILALLGSTLGWGQRRKEPTGPRAISVLEWTSRGLVLVPISLMIDGRFYDASVYRADPVPMALDEGNVYEVQRAGEPIGDFTITSPWQGPNNIWFGEGTWVSAEDRKKQEEARAKIRSTTAKPVTGDEDTGPPKLRRADKKPATSPPASTPAPEAPKAQPATATPEPTPAPLQETSNDPNRPLLRRGKPAGAEQATKLGNEKAPVKVPTKPPAGLNKVQVAVSDATITEGHPYAWHWKNAQEEQTMRGKAEKLAFAALNDYVSKTGGPKPGALEDVEVHAVDLAYNNSPDIILSARVLPAVEKPSRRKGAKTPAPTTAPSGFEYYVTIVGQEDIYTDLDKCLVAVTDNKHLDAFPRLQLVDAVDADGNGNGDLLFRQISDTGSAFVLYHVNSTRVTEILRVPEPKL
jgi:hypothetical protein